MRFASRGSPSPSEWDSPQGVSPLLSEWDSLHGGPLLQSEWDSPHGGPPLSRGSPSVSEWNSPQGVPPFHSEWDSLQGSPLFRSEWDSPEGGSPIQCEWVSPQGVPPSPMRMGFASRGSPSPKRMGFASRDSPSPQRQCFASKDLASPRHQHSSRASSVDNPFFSYHPSSLPKAIRKLMNPLWQPRLRLWLILSSKASRMPRSHLTILRRDLSTSLPMQEFQTLRFPRDRFWPSALRCQMPSLTHNRDSLIALRMEGYAIICCLLSSSSRRSPIRLLKEVS